MGRPKAAAAAKNHPARKVLAELPAKEIAEALGVAPTYVYSVKKNLTKAMADRIVEACGDGTAEPGKAAELARQYREAQEEPKSLVKQAMERKAAQPKTTGRKLSPAMDLVAQLLRVEGAFLVVPLDKLKGAGHE